LALKRWDSPPDQHRIEGKLLEWVRHRLKESPDSALQAFRALPLPYRRVFATRRLEAEVAEVGFGGFFRGTYANLADDALEALQAMGAEAHRGVLKQAMASRRLFLEGRRRRAMEASTRSFLELESQTSLMALRSRYIDREQDAFKDHF
jgi:hypothetical protein